MAGVRLYMLYDNEIIRVEFPDDWQIQEDEEGTIFALDPIHDGVQISVEIGGLRHDEPVDPRAFLEDVYADELKAGLGSFGVGDDERILLSWQQTLTHEQQDFALSYVQVARSQSGENLQLARFQLVIPVGAIEGSNVDELQQALQASAESAYFYLWSE